MSKNKAATAHGEVEYETVTCDSCGTEVIESDAMSFQIGTQLDKKYSRDVYVTGHACQHCADVGPAAYPEPSRLQYVREHPLFKAALIHRSMGGIHPIKLCAWLFFALLAAVVLSETLAMVLA
jgi:hypothetical protein